MPELTEAEAIIDAAQQAVAPTPVDPGIDFYLVNLGDRAAVIDVVEARAKYADHPPRATGHPKVYTAEAFQTYVDRHRTDDLEVWSDDRSGTVTAVFDSHASRPGWGQHRLTLQFRQTPDWQVWEQTSGKMMRQDTFAEFIEDHIENIVDPPAADMLELAQSFQAHANVVFESSKFLDSGHRELEYREQVEAKAGRRGQLAIPTEFRVALQPYVGLEMYGVKARFRYRINDGVLTLGYKLDRPDNILRTAFTEAVEGIARVIDAPILAGTSW